MSHFLCPHCNAPCVIQECATADDCQCMPRNVTEAGKMCWCGALLERTAFWCCPSPFNVCNGPKRVKKINQNTTDV